MTIRSLLIVAAALATPLAAAAGTEPFGDAPPVVRPGPPQILSDPYRWLPWREFTWRDGVKPGAPGLVEDAQGYIWAGTPEGLVRYNGQVWQRFDPPSAVSPAQTYSMVAARDGTMWLGTLDGRLLRLRGEVWSHDRPSGIPPGLVEVLTETIEEGRGTVWAGTSAGLARCQGAVCSEITALRGTTVRSLAATRSADGRLGFWIGTNRGLLRLDGADSSRPLLSPLFNDSTVLPGLSIRSLVETVGMDGERSLWVATDRGVARLKAGAWTRYDTGSGFAPGPVVKLLASRSASGEPVVWAGSFRSGLIRFQDDGRWQLFDSRSGLPANYVYNLLATGTSRDPTLWLATPAALVRLDRERWHAVDTRSGLPNDLVVGLGEATFPDGLRTYWIGTISGMVRFTKQGWERFLPQSSQVVFDAVNAREADGTESLWLRTLEGLQHFSHGRWTSYNTRNSPLPHDWITSLLVVPGRQGPEIWAGTSEGVAHFAGGRWTVYRGGAPGDLPSHAVWALAAAPAAGGEPVIWAGTEVGLARFDGRAWQAVSMPCQSRPRIVTVQIITDPDGVRWLWTGSRRAVARMRLDDRSVLQGPCETLSDRTRPALSDPTVNQIQTDVHGRIYVFTDWGVDRLTLPPGGGLSAARLESFDSGDGLPGMEFSRAAFRDHLGRIWAGASGGAAILDPAPPRDVAPGPGSPLLLEHVRVAGREHPLASHTVLRHDENSLEFQFTLLSFHREHATVYRTQLAGLEDSRPTPWSREARAVYNRLPRGDYTFRVWGRDGEGTVSGPLAVSFQVRPAPWLTSWAIALYALALVGLGWGFSHLRVKALARRAALLEHQVAERTRELAEANGKLELASLTDPLTSLSNRRFLDLNIGPDLAQAVRNAQSLLSERNADLIFYFIDLDHFKRLNDKAGHATGDAVLVEIGRRLREVARTTDAVVRWGGEEFLIVSRWANRQAGAVLASRTLEAVAGEPFGVDGETITITCSVGWAPYPWSTVDPEALPFEEVLSLADRALYLAKREGRNRSVGVLPGKESPGAGLLPDNPLETLEGRYVELIRQAGPDVVPSFSPASVDSGQIRTVTRAL